jgi:L-aspartate oxidase
VAAVLDNNAREPGDDLDLHVRDTCVAGAGLCDEAAVRDILHDAADGIGFLINNDCHFDRDHGRLELTREGGHSARRIVHAAGDSTGREVARSLATAVQRHPRITVVEEAFTIDLITIDGRITGVLYYRRGELIAALAGSTVLATGGCGWVWRETTNPAGATGDGLAMAYRAGAEVADCEFMQFHPTTLYIAGAARQLITEAMRGEGAVLKNNDGERFMPRYHPDAELAPRDVVSRSIIAELARTGATHAWLDATHLGADFVRQRFPSITRMCASFGIDVTREWLPVHPSAHFHCGGVCTDAQGRTTLPGLWAAGEVACTGLHGANRLASNSVLEGLVMGLRSGRSAAAAGGSPGRMRLVVPKAEPASDSLDVADLTLSLRALMWRRVGIERTAQDLATARRSLAFWTAHQARGEHRTISGWTLQNLLTVAALVTTAAEARTASVGTHFRRDSTGAVDPVHAVMRNPTA